MPKSVAIKPSKKRSNDTVSFYLNGEKKTITSPKPDMMLIDYLRSPQMELSGPKKPCGQGGCGGCTVVISSIDKKHADQSKPTHRAINSCLRPVTALNGLSVTTIEGTGSVEGTMNKVAHRLAANNGTQCGYCTNGWVMAMTGFLANEPDNRTKKDIEDLFDGNICRCTGYRSILEGMKTFASDWSKVDEENRMKCVIDPTFDSQSVAKTVDIYYPDGASKPVKMLNYTADGKTWIETGSMRQLKDALKAVGRKKDFRLIHGNTSFGIYKDEVEKASIYIDIRRIPDLLGIRSTPNSLSFGSGTNYVELIDCLSRMDIQEGSALSAVSYMAHRTAGSLVRNAASIGGNTMLVLEHIHRGEPFPSDMATALCGVNADIKFIRLTSGKVDRMPLSDLMEACRQDSALASDILLIRYYLDLRKPGLCLSQKTALREVNSHSIVNFCTNFSFKDTVRNTSKAIKTAPIVKNARITVGGIAPYAWQATKTEDYLSGQPLTMETLAKACKILQNEVKAQQRHWRKRLSDQPDEGFTPQYRNGLASGFLYKAGINAMLKLNPKSVPEDVVSAGINYWGNWPVSVGTQSYHTERYKAPLSEPFIKLMAMYQAQGEVRYTHETLATQGTSFGAVVGSEKAVGTYQFCHPETRRKLKPNELAGILSKILPEFVDLVTYEDIPSNGTNMQGMGADEPLFLPPKDPIMYSGQSLAMVLASDQISAENIARYIQLNCIRYKKSKTQKKPVLTIQDALSKDMVFPDCPSSASYMAHIWKVKRPDSDLSWVQPTTELSDTIKTCSVTLDGNSCMAITTSQECGGQLHFYMETQSAVAEPKNGGTMTIRASTQSPKSVHDAVVSTLGCWQNQIGVETPQLGGAYGGKTEQSRLTAAMAAVGSNKVNNPVHLALSRETDSDMIGRRHPYLGQYQLAVDDGKTDPDSKGLIRGLQGALWGDGGAYYDCSFVVSDCIQLRVDSAYYVPNYQTSIDVCQTNKAPNTAYRAFGDIQGTLILENAIENAAVALEMDAADIRSKNLYQLGQSTPGGQELEYCYQREVWDFALEKSDYTNRRKAVEEFNKNNKWRKRGICMMPLKYGSGYNLVLLEQTTALVSIYASDGTIMIQQGGADMGQGMITKITQIAAYTLDVPIDIIRIDNSDTRVIPNPSSTGASTGTQYNGRAVNNACLALRERLEKYCAALRKDKGEAWCKEQQINYWDHPKTGWSTLIDGGKRTMWQNIISLAFNNRINLQEQANAVIPGGTGIVPNVEFKPYDQQPKGTGIAIDPKGAFSETVNEYVGFTYNAACSEVEVDILTGEVKILRSDIIYDMGKSLNPAIDVGQIEGAFVQGVGYLLTENMVFEMDGPEAGRMNTPNTWRYKPPAITTIPLEMNVTLFPRELAKNVPDDPNSLFSSKEVGEPPMVLANTVFFAVKSAIRASRTERGMPALFEMSSPATVQTVHQACHSSK